MPEKIFHLWLMPDRKSAASFRKITGSLSKEFNTPAIEPHLSLLIKLRGNQKELIEKASKLAALLHSLPVEFEAIAGLPDVPRCIFWKAMPSKSLQDARKKSEEIFQTSDERGFMPHMSLLYAQMDSEKKKPIIAQIRSGIPLRCTLDSLWLVKDSGQFGVWPKVAEFRLKP